MIEIDHPTNKANFSIVTLGAYSVAFSYSTPIGFRSAAIYRWTVRVNDWGPTTGRHLNELDFGRKEERLDGDQFMQQLAAVIAAGHDGQEVGQA